MKTEKREVKDNDNDRKVVMVTAGEKNMYGERLEDLAVRVIHVADALPPKLSSKHIAMQMIRSGTSAGANYSEAQGAESRADFAHKIQIAVKELRETLFWLRITAKAELLPVGRLDPLMKEVDELIAIGVKSIVTAKRNAKLRK